MDPQIVPILSIVIVNWNTRDLLDDCLSSVEATAANLPIEILVVDNASSDDSVQMVQERFPEVKLLVNQANVGFAAANNQAFGECSAQYILLLNSDTCVHPHALQRMLAFMEDHPEAGAIGPKVVHPDMRLRVLSCGYQPTLRTLFNQYTGLSSLFPQSKAFRGINLLMDVHDDRVRQVEWISGACLLVRRSVIEQVGGLDEQWFMYAEDMEWCDRIARSGWRLYSVPTAIIDHVMGASTDRNQRVSTMWVKNLRSYYRIRSNPSVAQGILFDTILSAGLGLRAVLYAIRGLLDSQRRSLWWREASKFRMYAQAAMLSQLD